MRHKEWTEEGALGRAVADREVGVGETYEKMGWREVLVSCCSVTNCHELSSFKNVICCLWGSPGQEPRRAVPVLHPVSHKAAVQAWAGLQSPRRRGALSCAPVVAGRRHVSAAELTVPCFLELLTRQLMLVHVDLLLDSLQVPDLRP